MKNLITKKVGRLLTLEVGIFILMIILGYRFNIFISKNTETNSANQPFGISQKQDEIKGELVFDPNNDINKNISQGEAPSVTKVSYVGKSFRRFSYEAGEEKLLEVSGTCKDVYYAILIFNSKDDYVKNPGSARYNRASLCPTTKRFSEKIDLKSINLVDGTYYFFIADQGTGGSWYNPR